MSERERVENIGSAMAFGVAGMSLSLSMYKPFNPLLGETYQGVFPDGTTLSVEHISHHPPISVFSLDHPQYTLRGYYEYKAKTSATFNQVNIIYHGPNTIYLKASGQKITYNMPEIKVGGMIWGDRLTKVVKSMVFHDQEANLKGVVGFGYQKSANGKVVQKQADSIYGSIYRCSGVQKSEDPMKMGDLMEQYVEVTGNYLKSMELDGVTRWSLDKDVPLMVLPADNPLPSDWRFREDLIWLHYGDMGRSERWKIRLEQEQRRHRRLRGGKK